MKNRKKLKVFISILCTLALLISNFSPLSWKGNSLDEVQAADTVDLSTLDEITWSDFGVEEVYLCMDVTVNTTSEWTEDIGIRFDDYMYSADQADMAITRYVSVGETTEIRFNANDFAEEQAVKGLGFVVFGGPNYEATLADGTTSDRMTMTISNVRLEGAVNKDIDMSSATWLKGADNTGIGGANGLGDITYNEGTTTISNFCRFSGYKVAFAEAASLEEETIVRFTITGTNSGGATVPVTIINSSATGALGNLYSEPFQLVSGTTQELDVAYESLANANGEIEGFSFATWAYSGTFNYVIEQIAIVKGDKIIKTCEISNTAMQCLVGGQDVTGIDGNSCTGTAAFADGKCTVTNCSQYSLQKFLFTENLTAEETETVEETVVRFTITGTNSGGATVPVTIINSSATGALGNLYSEPFQLISGTTQELDVAYESLANANGEIEGFSFATWAYSGTFNYVIEQIAIVKGDKIIKTCEISNTAMQCLVGGQDVTGIDGNSCTGTAAFADGKCTVTNCSQYSLQKFLFTENLTAEETETVEETVVRFTITGTNSGGATVPVTIINSSATGALGNLYSEPFQLVSGTTQELDVAYESLANANGEIEGFSFATWAYSGTFNYVIEQIAIVKGDKIIKTCEISNTAMQCLVGGQDVTGIDGNSCTGTAAFADGKCTVTNCSQYSLQKFLFTENLTAESENTVFALQTLSTLNNTLFNGDIELSSDGVFYYGAAESGLSFSVTENGGLLLSATDYEFSNSDIATEYQASVYGLDTFVNRRFNIKIATTDVAVDGSSATITVWINNVMLGDGSFTITLKNSSGDAMNQTMVFHTSEVFALDATAPDIVQVPTGLTDLTWEDFGITCIGQTNASGYLSGKEMNNSLFSGDITMAKDAHIRYAGGTADMGLHVWIHESGNIILYSDTCDFENEYKGYEPSLFGLETFIDTKFNLKIAITDMTSTSATVGVWVNDIILGDYFTLTCSSTDYSLGNCLALTTGTIEPHSTLEKPTGLKDIRFGDWNAEVYNNNLLETDETSTGQHPDVTTLIGTSLKENIKFSGTTNDSIDQYIFCYGGLQGENKTWYGLRFGFVGDQICIYNVSESAGYVDHVYLDAAKVGIDGFSFYDREYLWQVDITAQGNHVLVWMYFDGHLYGGAPIAIKDLADKMASSLVFYPNPDGVAQPATLGVADRPLSDLYHDLDESEYIIPSGVITMQKKNIVDGVENWVDMTVEGGDTITDAGDYKITYNDDVSNYTQEVVLWRSGDTKINDQDTVGAADLVRLIKQTKGTVNSAYKCEEWAYDVNRDYTVDTETDSMKNVEVVTLREMILGTYKEDTSTKMPIVGYVGPTGDVVKDEIYQKIQKAGITIIVDNGNEGAYSEVPSSRYYTYEQLTLAQKYGLKMYVPDNQLKENRASITETDTTVVANTIKHYKNYQSFAGSFICDEPWTYTNEQIEDAATNNEELTVYSEYINLAQAINGAEVDGKVMYGYANAMGYVYSRVNNGTAAYKYVNYLDSYVKEYQMSFVSSTNYPFLRESDWVADEGAALNGSDYFKSYALSRYIANNNNIPFWSFVQAGDSFEFAPDDKPLSEGEFKWSANMGLAFGSKGIQYFTMVQPSSFNQSTNGLIANTGVENEYYGWAIDVNTQVTAIDDILMNATNKGIMTTGTHATAQAADNVDEIMLYESTWNAFWGSNGTDVGMDVYNDGNGYAGATVTCTDSTYGALTGCFETSDGKHALYIVNYNPESENTVTVNVGSGVTATMIQDGNTTEATGSATVNLGAGEAVLVVF